MGSSPGGHYARDRRVVPTVYFLFYVAVFLAMFFDHRLLSQVQPVLFNFNRDLTELAVIATGLPGWMIAHPGSFAVADVLAFLLPVPLLFYSTRKGQFSRGLGILFLLFLALYWLLADIFWQVHHEPFILYVLIPLAFITNREDRFYSILQGCRYYFLYVFVSAAVWKIARGAVFNGEEMSRILLVHHSDWLSGDPTSLISRVYAWLIDHPLVAQGLYLGGVVFEATFVLGLFTRRYDRLLMVLAIVFVLADWWVMRIPYWPILLGGITLWVDTRPRRRMIVVYETTHHENLPALLDLCETRFPQVRVFLKDISYRNISGSAPLAARWPKTEFVVQAAGQSNRSVIRSLFRFLRRNRCSHLHLSTLDNNIFLFALRLCSCHGLQVSLTVHEVNEYFALPFASLRDATESVAKPLLHRRIKHYSFFLPAMATHFRQRMPDATAMFIPSRFYASRPPEQASRPPVQASRPPEQAPPMPGPTDAKPFTIVIPGSVDGNRRDYEGVIAIFRSWPTTMPPVELVILGDSRSPYGAGIIAQLQQLASDRFRSRHFEGYIPETVYEKEIEAADLLWSPLRVHKKGSRNNPEVYGQTTASGLTADLLLNNAPALAP
ncbi:hypothetical protein, partial [Puia sp.]|uniref:hypothetical protein n=1 Tax=Puia sp. TaxID=2045100 RepID=UPI002F41460C